MGLRKFVKNVDQSIPVSLLTGRSIFGDHHTNATFRRDSNGKTFGIPRRTVTKRHHRAGYKNLLRSIGWMFAFIVWVIAMVIQPLFVGLITALTIVGYLYWRISRVIKRKRARRATRRVVEPLGKALSSIPATGEADMEKAVTLVPKWQGVTRGTLGEIVFPDTFHANEGERTHTENLVQSRIPKPIELLWRTNKMPIKATIVTAPPLPGRIDFLSKLADLRKCTRGTYITGYDKDDKPYILSHMGDWPMKGYSMNTGTGKSTLLRCQIAQLLHNEPDAMVIIWDTKRVSLSCFAEIPGFTMYNDPRNMAAMWKGWEDLKALMDDRYAQLEIDPTTEFDPVYAFLEEGNDFAIQIKAYWRKTKKAELKSKDANPAIWFDIAEVLFQGREVGIFVSAVEQLFLDKYFGGMSLRGCFGTIGMAGFKPQLFKTINGVPPSLPYQSGQGRICFIEGSNETWVQGLYAPPEVLTRYAAETRVKVSAGSGKHRVETGE
jgi:hypothetical protein